MGKGREERDEITRGIDKRNAEKDGLRARFRELLHCEPSDEDLLRFELWEEQQGRCPARCGHRLRQQRAGRSHPAVEPLR